MPRSAEETRPERFPFFPSGDVNIVVTDARQYQLHSSVLKNSSPLLERLLHPADAAQLTAKAVKAGVTTQYKLMVVESAAVDGRVDYVLEPVRLDPNGRPRDGNPRGVRAGFEGGRSLPGALAAYGAVLGAMYGEPIDLGDFHEDGLAHLMSNAVEITEVAEYLGCVHVVTKPIEASLLTTGQAIHHGISNHPSIWLNFGNRIQSKALFREALIHAAGQFKQPLVQKAINNREIPDEVIAVLQRKADWIKSGVTLAERHIASYYPSNLMREKTVGRIDRENLGRSNYGNQITGWIALAAFRHWCCDMMASDQTHNALDMGFAFMQAVNSAGQAYLSTHLMQSQFHQRFPMSAKLMACVEHRLDEIKANVRQWAEPLQRNTSHLDVKQFPVAHYVHTQVTEADYPWFQQDAMTNTDMAARGAYDDDDGNDADDELLGGSADHGDQPHDRGDGHEGKQVDDDMGEDDQVMDMDGEDDYEDTSKHASGTSGRAGYKGKTHFTQADVEDAENAMNALSSGRAFGSAEKGFRGKQTANKDAVTTKPPIKRNTPFREEDAGSDTEIDEPSEEMIEAAKKDAIETKKRHAEREARLAHANKE